LIICSVPKPLLSMTLYINTIESIGELEPNRKLILIHTPFIIHDTMVGHFYYRNRTVKPKFSLRRYIGIQLQLPFPLFSRIGWSNFLISSVIGFIHNKTCRIFCLLLCYYILCKCIHLLIVSILLVSSFPCGCSFTLRLWLCITGS